MTLISPKGILIGATRIHIPAKLTTRLKMKNAFKCSCNFKISGVQKMFKYWRIFIEVPEMLT